MVNVDLYKWIWKKMMINQTVLMVQKSPFKKKPVDHPPACFLRKTPRAFDSFFNGHPGANSSCKARLPDQSPLYEGTLPAKKVQGELPSLKLTFSPLKIGFPNRKVVFQPSIFRGKPLVSGRVHPPKKLDRKNDEFPMPGDSIRDLLIP